MENHTNFSFKAPYYTLNELTENTKHIWIVCHGYGQLAPHFIKRFDILDSHEHFILALQGLSRFYVMDNSGRVGASWMTKEDRLTDLENQQSYVDSVFREVFKNIDLSKYKINLLGFSQGVSMIARLAVFKKITFDKLILWAGGFPPELSREDFDFTKTGSSLKIVLGENDQFFKLEKYQKEIQNMEHVVGLKPETILFEGKHELNREVLLQVANSV